MVDLDDALFARPVDEELARHVTGLDVESSGHVLVDKAGIRSTQRVTLRQVDSGVAVLTWPAELGPQAKFLYSHDRGRRLLAAAEEGRWDVEARPHLAFWLAKPAERLYLTPPISPSQYVGQWCDGDLERVGEHPVEELRPDLWPWLIDRGYASQGDAAGLDEFIARLRARNRPAHLRPGIRLLRTWPADEVRRWRGAGTLAANVREAINRLLLAAGDFPLPRS